MQMDKITKHQKGNFTTVSNTLINDKSLTYKAKGVFVYLWSKPDDWVVRIQDLINNGKEGKTAIYTALQELEDYGYLKRKRYYENGKIAGINYNLYEEKLSLDDLNTENLNEENLNEENQPHNNKELIPNTELLLKKENTKKEALPLPDFLNPSVWADWEKHRKELKKKLTPEQIEKQLNKLENWHKQGYDVHEIINNAIEKGWRGLYIPSDVKRKSGGFDPLRVNHKNYDEKAAWMGAQE